MELIVRNTGKNVLSLLESLGRSYIFFINILAGIPSVLVRPGLLIKQIYMVGVLSLSIVVVSGTFVGAVLALQLFYELQKFGAEQSLGVLNAISLVRELGPVVAGLLFSGRACSALSAEIGLMKATEQLSGLEMMAIDPLRRVIAPRFLAGFISMPILALTFSMCGILGGHIVGVELLGIDVGAFWSQMQAKVSFMDDVINGVVKSMVFGTVVTWIALYQGYDCVPTSEGVSRSTTKTVVYASLWILALDFILTALMYGEI